MPSSLPPSIKPLWSAVVRALTTATGKPRALPTERLFKLGFAPAVPETARPLQVHERKRCWVAVISPRIIDPQLEMSDRQRWQVTIEITCWYTAGHELSLREAQAAYEAAIDDVTFVRAALCYPGALAEDAGGVRTGLDGGSLANALTVAGPVPVPDAGLIRVVYAFTTSLEVAAPPVH